MPAARCTAWGTAATRNSPNRPAAKRSSARPITRPRMGSHYATRLTASPSGSRASAGGRRAVMPGRRSELELPGLAEGVASPAAVRLLADQAEAGVLVEVTGGAQLGVGVE